MHKKAQHDGRAFREKGSDPLNSAASLAEQQNEYIELFRYELNKSDMENIRASWQSGTPLGSERFKKKVEERLSQKVGRARRGRPAKETKGG